jgi:hypothetical protein
VVVDDTQAFFRRPAPATCSFNSARKFFGVPDGAYLYGEDCDSGSLPPSDAADCDHLLARLAGDRDAWDLFRRHESRIGVEPRAMSEVARRILATIDYGRSRLRRAENFAVLHRRLQSHNMLDLPLDNGSGAPLCYPFLPAGAVDRGALARMDLYVPTFWPEIDGRAGGGHEWERDLARRLLPLPIDQRYGVHDMERLATALLQVLA